MRWMSLSVLSAAMLAGGASADAPPAAAPPAVPSTQPLPAPAYAPSPSCAPVDSPCCQGGDLFASDRAFDGFVGPISNPVLSKDPRSLTEVRFLFVDDVIPGDNPVGGGSIQVYGAQVRLALSDRLTFIADKDGFAAIHTHNLGDHDGWLNIDAGLKYLLIRDVEDQFLLSTGFQYEIPSGSSHAFQGVGDGDFDVWVTGAKQIGEKAHVLGTTGIEIPVSSEDNSGFVYSCLHIDRQVFCFLYPLAELNWFHYTSGGHHGLPAALGEGDGLINLGTSGVAGEDLVTAALGAKAHLGEHTDVGAAYEFPLTGDHDLISNRVLAELILRY